MNTQNSAAPNSANIPIPQKVNTSVNEGHSFFCVKLREFVEREALDYDQLRISENTPVEDMDSHPDVFYNTAEELIIGEAKPNKSEISGGSDQMLNYLTYAAKHADNRKVTIVYSVPWNHHYLVYRMFDRVIKENPNLASLVDGRVNFEFRCIGEEYNESIKMPASLGDRFHEAARPDVKIIGDEVIHGTFKYIPIEQLFYDENNIRLYGSGANLTQKQCEQHLARELTVNNTHGHAPLVRSIANMKSSGAITETLYGEPREDGGVDILEGNRRLYYANHLHRNAKEAPGYAYLPVFVFDRRLAPHERILYKSYLQESGKIHHLRHARAYEIWQLSVRDDMDDESIAKFMVLENTDVVRYSVDCCEMCFNMLKLSDEEYVKYYSVVYAFISNTRHARGAGKAAHAADESKGITVENMIRAVIKSGNDDWGVKVGIGAIKQMCTAYNNIVRMNDDTSNVTKALQQFCKVKQGYITPKEWMEKYKAASGHTTFTNVKTSFKSGCKNLLSFQNALADLGVQDKLSNEQALMVEKALRELEDSIHDLRTCVSKTKNWQQLDKINAGDQLGK